MSSANTTLDDITEAMKDVIDPELGINVIDLGLVYDMRLDENNVAILDMTSFRTSTGNSESISPAFCRVKKTNMVEMI